MELIVILSVLFLIVNRKVVYRWFEASEPKQKGIQSSDEILYETINKMQKAIVVLQEEIKKN